MSSPKLKNPTLPSTPKAPWTIEDALEVLFEALEVDPTEVKSVDIRANGVVRIVSEGNVFRSKKFEPFKKAEADE